MNGMVKVTWQDVREKVNCVEPVFAEMVDALNPGKNLPLFLAYYPYGAIKGDTISTFFPDGNGQYYRITDADAPADVVKHLGYSKNFAPFALLLEKNMELFVDLPEQRITLPRMLYSPGAFFPFARILKNQTRTYAPNNVMTMTSGARSVFMLPNIGCATHHSNLVRDYNIHSQPAKSLYDHWHVFKDILHSPQVECDWRSCLLYFSEGWLEKIAHDPAWMPIKLYLHELAWKYYEYDRNHFYYDLAYSMIQKKRNLKPNPYLTDTARHLIATALGAAPGYIPATDDHALPNALLQKIFVESYGLKKYFPTILQPARFNYESDHLPIYYSLQHPATHMFSPKSCAAASTLAEIRELERITRVFVDELAKNDSACSDTVIKKIAEGIQFNYYHNKDDMHKTIRKSENIQQSDPRFTSARYHHHEANFAADAPFVRGCVSIQMKHGITSR